MPDLLTTDAKASADFCVQPIFTYWFMLNRDPSLYTRVIIDNGQLVATSFEKPIFVGSRSIRSNARVLYHPKSTFRLQGSRRKLIVLLLILYPVGDSRSLVSFT